MIDNPLAIAATGVVLIAIVLLARTLLAAWVWKLPGDDDKRRQEIQRRWNEIDAELKDIRACKVTPGTDPATREGELLEELDALEYESGDDKPD